MKKGDLVKTKEGFWWLGEDVGDRLATVVDTKSYILIEILNYHSNPVKCFKNEVRLVSTVEDILADLKEDFEDLFDQLNLP